MALKIYKQGDILITEVIKILIYGSPGVGKSSLSLTANDVLLMDFDIGAHRSAFNDYGQVLRFETWDDVTELMKMVIEENGEPLLKDGKPVPYLSQFKTIVIDTVGRCLDALMASIIKANPKAGTNSGSPSISGWGDLKSGFAMWLNELTQLGIDIIMIAHEKDKDKGEQSFIRPAITGGSYDAVLQQCDFVGRMYHGAKAVELNFSPTEFTIGKNSAKFPILSMPDFNKQPKFFAGKMKEMKDKLNSNSEADKEIRNSVEQAKAGYATYTELNQFNEARSYLGSFKFISVNHEKQIKKALIDAADKFGAVFNTETKAFEMKPESVEQKKEAPKETAQAPISTPIPAVTEDEDNPSDYAPVVDAPAAPVNNNPFLPKSK